MPADIKRDRFDRPLIKMPDGTERPYSRASGLANAIEDDYKLQKWHMRMVAIGLAQRPDLIVSVNAHRDDKDQMDRLVNKCKDAAKSDARATIGTALHTITETVDRGQDPGYIPDEYQQDLESYLKRTRPLFDHFAIEQFCVCDELEVAGTPDRMSVTKHKLKAPDGTIIPPGTGLVTDLKTSETLKYGGIKFATQLAVYAHALPYDIEKEERLEWEHPIDQNWGVIYHVPVKSGTASLYWVDIKTGWEMAQLSVQVKKARSKWDLLLRGDYETQTGATFSPVKE